MAGAAAARAAATRARLGGDLSGVAAAVVGLGVSGRAMALHLLRRGAIVWGLDEHASPTSTRALRAAGARVVLGPWPPPADASAWDLVALSPGVPPAQPWLRRLAAAGAAVVGELALAPRPPFRWAAVTGTNGKSTTCALVAHLLCGQGLRAVAGGNFGTPYLQLVDAVPPPEAAVVELSSYQLEAAGAVRPAVGVVLNLTPDHAGRHPAMADYAAAKAQLVAAVAAGGRLVLNADCGWVRDMATSARAPIWWLYGGDRGPPPARRPGWDDGAWCLGRDRLVADGGAPQGALDLSHPILTGGHGRLNIAAAALAAEALAPVGTLAARRPALLGFAGLPHRLQPVGEAHGIAFVDDSKATNDAAAAAAVAAQVQPFWLLCGGEDKGGGYAALAAALARAPAARGVVAFGAARAAIHHALAGVGPPVSMAASLAAACALAVDGARPGETVLLAPACASFDAFSSYRARGAAFAAWAADWGRRPVGGAR